MTALRTMHVYDTADSLDTMVDDDVSLERVLALASLDALRQRLASILATIARTSARNRKSPWHRVRVLQRDRLRGQIEEMSARVYSL